MKKQSSKRVQECKSIKVLLALLLLYSFTLVLPTETEAQNCPLDWHPPPCGNPPKPVKDREKEVAKAASREHEKAGWYFAAAAMINCMGAKYLGDENNSMGLACLASGAGVLASQIAKATQDRIVNDPYDPEYGSPYGGRWLSYAELGLDQIAPSGNPYVNNIAEHLQAIEMLGDFIGVSVDRTMSCYQAGIDTGWWHDCQIWQEELVKYGLIWFGQRFDALAYNLWYLAEQLTQQGADAELIWNIQNMAGWTYWAGGEYQQ